MAEDSERAAAEEKVAEFTESLKRRLRNFHPRDYLPFAAQKLRWVMENRDAWRRYPPHFILQSMEANCAFHRRGHHAAIKARAFEKLIDVYADFDDPAAMYTLDQGRMTDLDLFMLAQARQQFVVQEEWGIYDFASAVLMFLEGSFRKTEPLFRKNFGLGFSEWIKACLFVFLASDKENQGVIVNSSYVRANQSVLSDEVITAIFRLLSRSVGEVRSEYLHARCELPSPLLELQLPFLLAEKPLVQIEKDGYVVTHARFLSSRAAGGIYDLCHAHFEDTFGKEIGVAFERYVRLLINELPGEKTLMSEADLAQCIQGQVCDYLLAIEDIVILVECKAISYSSNFLTENAVRKANSTAKIVEGFRQLSNVAEQLHHPQISARIGDLGQRLVIGVVLTYRDIQITNSPLYHSIIDPQVDFAKAFTWQPQVIDIRALQMLILCARGGLSLASMFRQKLGSEPHIRHAWDVYLDKVFRDQKAEGRNSTIPLLEDTWREFSQASDQGDSGMR